MPLQVFRKRAGPGRLKRRRGRRRRRRRRGQRTWAEVQGGSVAVDPAVL